jgi:hypothetical protein
MKCAYVFIDCIMENQFTEILFVDSLEEICNCHGIFQLAVSAVNILGGSAANTSDVLYQYLSLQLHK